MRLFLAMKEKGGTPFVIQEHDARSWNDKGFAIFKTVNSFKDNQRNTEHLEKILGWHCDIDKGTKEEQLKRIEQAPVVPSVIIESKRGFQCYWVGKNITQWTLDKEGKKEISTNSPYRAIQNALVKFFDADPNAKDHCRYMRAVGYFHLKDPNDPFLVKEVYLSNIVYSESWMLQMFVKKEKKKIIKYNIDLCKDIKSGLMKLSGSPALNGDSITFKTNPNGTEQIWVNGESTACWIDKQGFIGSHAKGGPTLVQWIKYYGYNFKQAKGLIEKYGI